MAGGAGGASRLFGDTLGPVPASPKRRVLQWADTVLAGGGGGAAGGYDRRREGGGDGWSDSSRRPEVSWGGSTRGGMRDSHSPPPTKSGGQGRSLWAGDRAGQAAGRGY